MKFLNEQYRQATHALVHTPETEHFRNVQGQAQALRMLMKAIDPESVD
jgi:hypothetical protein